MRRVRDNAFKRGQSIVDTNSPVLRGLYFMLQQTLPADYEVPIPAPQKAAGATANVLVELERARLLIDAMKPFRAAFQSDFVVAEDIDFIDSDSPKELRNWLDAAKYHFDVVGIELEQEFEEPERPTDPHDWLERVGDDLGSGCAKVRTPAMWRALDKAIQAALVNRAEYTGKLPHYTKHSSARDNAADAGRTELYTRLKEQVALRPRTNGGKRKRANAADDKTCGYCHAYDVPGDASECPQCGSRALHTNVREVRRGGRIGTPQVATGHMGGFGSVWEILAARSRGSSEQPPQSEEKLPGNVIRFPKKRNNAAALKDVYDYSKGPKPPAFAKAMQAVQRAFPPNDGTSFIFVRDRPDNAIELHISAEGYHTKTIRGRVDVMPSVGGDFLIPDKAPDSTEQVKTFVSLRIMFVGTKTTVKLDTYTRGRAYYVGDEEQEMILWTGRGFGPKAVEAVQRAARIIADWNKKFSEYDVLLRQKPARDNLAAPRAHKPARTPRKPRKTPKHDDLMPLLDTAAMPLQAQLNKLLKKTKPGKAKR